MNTNGGNAKSETAVEKVGFVFSLIVFMIAAAFMAGFLAHAAKWLFVLGWNVIR